MNVERINSLIDYLTKLPDDRFNMADSKSMSEVVMLSKRSKVRGNLAAHTVGLFKDVAEDAVRARKCGGGTTQLAQYLLQLDAQQAGDLLLGLAIPKQVATRKGMVTRCMAIAALMNLRDDGKVKWI